LAPILKKRAIRAHFGFCEVTEHPRRTARVPRRSKNVVEIPGLNGGNADLFPELLHARSLADLATKGG
jgi:hypothetical protein